MLEKVILRSHGQTGQAAFLISLDVAMDPRVELKKWMLLLEGLKKWGTQNLLGC